MERVYLSDVIDITKFKRGQANIIVAPCHSGKTTAAIAKIASLATCREKVLFLIDTTAGKESLLDREETEKYTKQWLKEIELKWWGSLSSGDGIRIMTYHQFGYQVHENPDFLKDIEIVICDEMHNLIKYKGIEHGQNKSKKAIGTPNEQISCKAALKELVRVSSEKENAPIVVIMTATVDAVSFELDKWDVPVESFNCYGLVTEDKTEHTHYYSDIISVLQNLPFDCRAIVYVASITQMRELAKLVDDGWRTIICLWGVNNPEHKMSEEQMMVRDIILKTKRIPSHVDILFINAAYETSINIENEDFMTMVVHSSNQDTQIQARGRLRHDIHTLYLYDRKHEHIKDYFPEEYYNKFLTTAETSHIAEVMNLVDEKGNHRRWRSIVAALKKDGIIAIPLKKHGQRGWILQKPNNGQDTGCPL